MPLLRFSDSAMRPDLALVRCPSPPYAPRERPQTCKFVTLPNRDRGGRGWRYVPGRRGRMSMRMGLRLLLVIMVASPAALHAQTQPDPRPQPPPEADDRGQGEVAQGTMGPEPGEASGNESPQSEGGDA